MGGNTKVWFVIGAFSFILIITQLGALMGETLISNAPPSPATLAAPPSNFLATLGYIAENIGYFFTLMGLSSTYAILGIVLLILTVGMIWAVIELIRGV